MTVIVGTVRAEMGDPLVDARVLFSRGPVALPDIATLTDGRGRFSLTAPAPGTYELTAVAGDLSTKRELDLAPGGERVEAEMRMGRQQ